MLLVVVSAWMIRDTLLKINRGQGVDYLGACTYNETKEFLSGGHYDDMKIAAKQALMDKLKAVDAVYQTVKGDL